MHQKTLFPDGVFYDVENNQYLTKNTNKFIELIDCILGSYDLKTKEEFPVKAENSSLVAELPRLSNQILSDWLLLNNRI
jgi:hypothetical protein